MAVIMPHSVMIHIAKTGGTWCRRAITAAGIHHFESGPANWHEVRRNHANIRRAHPTAHIKDWRKGNKKPHKRCVFTFVRNPFAWLESVWADSYLRKRRPNYVPKNTKIGIDFPTYIDTMIDCAPDAPSQEMFIGIGYYRDKTDDGLWHKSDIFPDFIGKTENLVDSFITALRVAGETFNEAKVRAVKPQRVAGRKPEFRKKIIWSESQRVAVYDANKQLFKQFGYGE